MSSPQQQKSTPSTPNTPVSGVKRELQFTSPSLSSSPSAKIELCGYVLYVSAVLKQEYFQVQFQTDGGVQHFNSYSLKHHNDFNRLFSRGLRASVELRKSRGNQSMYFGGGCLIREASTTEVPFQLNDNLKSGFINDSQSKDIAIKELHNINPKLNRIKFTTNAVITVGDGDYATIPTHSKEGSGQIKSDILAEDTTGHIHLQLFKDQVQQFESGCSYNLSHMALKKYDFRLFLHTTNQSSINKIAALKIKSEASVLLKKSKLELKVPEFTQVRKVDVFKPCPSCTNKFELVKEDEKWVWCKCTSRIKRSRFMMVKSKFQAEVEFLLKKQEFMWATVFSSAFQLEIDLATKDEVENFLSDKEDMNVVVDTDKKLITEVK